MSLLAKLLGRSPMESVPWLEPDELLTLLNNPSPPLVIDVRGPEEFRGPFGHIDTARNIPLDQLPIQADRLLGERRPLVLVCHTDRRSSAAAAHLRKVGGTDLAILRGGMVAWQARAVP